MDLDKIRNGEIKNLCGANLRGVNLCGANLRGADLYKANLRGADLCGADLREANLREANLYKANLCGVNLREADLCGVNLYKANLRGANLRGADLDFASFPLWCGGLGLKVDDRLVAQLLYHIASFDTTEVKNEALIILLKSSAFNEAKNIFIQYRDDLKQL